MSGHVSTWSRVGRARRGTQQLGSESPWQMLEYGTMFYEVSVLVTQLAAAEIRALSIMTGRKWRHVTVEWTDREVGEMSGADHAATRAVKNDSVERTE